MKYLPFLFLFLLTACLAGAQTGKHAADIRKTATRIYQEKSIFLFPGEKLRIQSGNVQGKLRKLSLQEKMKSEITDFNHMTAVIAQHNVEDHLSLDLEVIEPGEGNTLSVLLVKNPYKKRLIYRAKVLREGSRRFERVRVQPVIPGLTGVVTWNFRIMAVKLNHLKVATND